MYGVSKTYKITEAGTMTRIDTSKLRQHLPDTLNKVAYKGERILLSRYGKPLAAIVSIEDLARLEELEDREDNAAADAALLEVQQKGTVPWEKIKKDLRLSK